MRLARRFLLLLTVILIVASPLLILMTLGQNTTQLVSSADSWVEAEYPNINHGSETVLRIKADSRIRRTYMKFDLNSLPNGKIITSVKLYLYCTTIDINPTVVVNVHETQDAWAENTITWNNAPPVGAFITDTTVGSSGQYYCWNITSYGLAQYNGDKILSVVVKLPLDDPSKNNPNYSRDFASKEYTGTTSDPYLEVTYNDSPPVASFSYSPDYPMANDTVTFNASASYDPDGNIVSYKWDYGDGNITIVSNPTITHVYLTYGNYTVTLTVTDNTWLTCSQVEIVEVVDPAVLRVSLPEGTYVKQHLGDSWIDEGWLLYKTGNSWSFTVKIYDTSCHVKSYDTHLIIALNDAAYSKLLSISVNGTSIPQAAFKYGKPKPYNTRYWSDCVYPTRFNDTYVNVGYIPPKGFKTVTVSVTFSDATNARMHFDAYGSTYNGTPCSWSHVTWSPHSEDSTVLYQAAPLPLSVSITPLSAVIDLGQSVSFTSNVSGGTSPYFYQWYVNNTAVSGANSSSWIFTPISTGYYLVHLNVTDSTGNKAKSNISPVTVNQQLFVSISPASSVIKLGQSVNFTSTVVGGTSPYSYQWYLNETAVSGATSSFWVFTPNSTGYYVVSLKVTDDAHSTAVSNDAYVTVSLPDYYLTVKTDPSGITTISGEGWYTQGTKVTLTAPATVPGPTDTQYRFNYWDVDGTSQGSGVNPIIVTMIANHTATAHYVTQYVLTIKTNGLPSAHPTKIYLDGSQVGTASDASPYTIWFDAGTYTGTIGVDGTVSGATGTRYVFTKWVEDSSASNPRASEAMNSPKTFTAQYKTQYLLTVQTDPIRLSPQPTRNPAGEAGPADSWWYDASTNVTLTAQPVSGYTFIKWDVDSVYRGSGVNPISVIMDAVHTATAHYFTRYLIVFDQTGLDSTATGIVVTINGVGKTYSQLPNSTWFDSGTQITYLYSNVSSTISGKRFNLASVTGPTSPFFVTSNVTITGNYKTQYLLSFAQSGSAVAPTVTYTADTDPTGTVPFGVWVKAGSQITYDYQSIVLGSQGTRYVLISTNPPSPQNVNGPLTITGTYKTQYKITVTASPGGVLGGTFKATYTQCGTTYTNVQKTTAWTEWVDASTTVTLNEPQDIINSGSNTKYKFDHYDPSASVTMDQAKTITLSYKTQYYLTLNTNPAEVLTLNPAAVSGQGWYNSGDTANVDAVQNVDKVAGKSRYDFRSWTGATPTGVGNKATVLMDGPKTATANYQLQYKVTFTQTGVNPLESGDAVIVIVDGSSKKASDLPFSKWVDSGSSVTYSYSPTVSSSISGKRFILTDVTGPPSPINNLLSDVTVSGNYKTQYLLKVRTEPTCLIPQPTRNVSGDPDPYYLGWWYDSSTHVSLTAPDVSFWNHAQYNFANWNIDGTNVTGNPYTVHMDKPHEAIAYYKGTPPVGGITVPINKPTFVSTNIFTALDTWISLALTLIYAAAGTAILVHLKKRRK